jgi:hypothetical protein
MSIAAAARERLCSHSGCGVGNALGLEAGGAVERADLAAASAVGGCNHPYRGLKLYRARHSANLAISVERSANDNVRCKHNVIFCVSFDCVRKPNEDRRDARLRKQDGLGTEPPVRQHFWERIK